MTNERAPEAPRDERLLNDAEVDQIRLYFGVQRPNGLGIAPLFDHIDALTEQLAVAERNRSQSLADTARLRDDRDALTTENARLVAALEDADQWLEPQPGKPFAGILEARIAINAVLTGRSGGEDVV